MFFEGWMLQESEKLGVDVAVGPQLMENLETLGYKQAFPREITLWQFKHGTLAINLYDVTDFGAFLEITIPETKIDKTQTELKGLPVSRGKLKGIVRILHSPKEMDKMEEGDVLVTAMTSPDFIFAMKKAGAIVTDEGGMTSHAAIVSRELGKPCIVGTKIATKLLKDGDLIEVDAEKGVVKILEK